MSKNKPSERTSQLRIWYWCFRLISTLCFIGPAFVFTLTALLSKEPVVAQKFALCGSVVVVLIMTLVALLNKTVLRCRLWILLLGIYVCLDNIIVPLITIAVCQILDEIVFTPLYKHFGNKLRINKEIDLRR